jgi:hypothetical protein
LLTISVVEKAAMDALKANMKRQRAASTWFHLFQAFLFTLSASMVK